MEVNDIIEQIFKGPSHQQLRDVLQYIRNTIIMEKVVKHSDRAEADKFFIYLQQWRKLYQIQYTIVHTMNESQVKCGWKRTELKLSASLD